MQFICREPTRLKTDEPFTVMFSIAGVNNDTGHVINWVTANNVTNVSFYNASDIDLKDNRRVHVNFVKPYRPGPDRF